MFFFNWQPLRRFMKKSKAPEDSSSSSSNQDKHPDHVLSFMEAQSILSSMQTVSPEQRESIYNSSCLQFWSLPAFCNCSGVGSPVDAFRPDHSSLYCDNAMYELPPTITKFSELSSNSAGIRASFDEIDTAIEKSQSMIRAREGSEYPFRFDKIGVMDVVAALSEVLTPEQASKMCRILDETAQAYGKIYGNGLEK